MFDERWGGCRFCGQNVTAAGVARHVSSCRARKSTAPAGRWPSLAVPDETWHHLKVTSGDYPEYWLDVLAAPEAGLVDLDNFLRAVWTEGGDHLSAFTIRGREYMTAAFLQHEPGAPEVEDAALADLGAPKRMRWRFDFGTTMAVDISYLQPVTHAADDAAIVLAARNHPPRYRCACGHDAIIVCSECLTVDPTEAYLCERCAADHRCGWEMLSPLANTPRCGTPGFSHAEFDRLGDYPSFERAQFCLRRQEPGSTEHTLAFGDEDARDAVVRRALEELERDRLDTRVLRSVRLMNAYIDPFREPLAALLSDELDRVGLLADSLDRPTAVIALYLLAAHPEPAVPDDTQTSGAAILELLLRHLREAAGRLVDDRTWLEVQPRMQSPQIDRWTAVTHLFASLGRSGAAPLPECAGDPVFPFEYRRAAIEAFVGLHLSGHVDRSEAVEALHALAGRALAEANVAFGDLVAHACIVAHPDGLVRDVQHLVEAELVEDRSEAIDMLRSTLGVGLDAYLRDPMVPPRFALIHNAVEALAVDRLLVPWEPDGGRVFEPTVKEVLPRYGSRSRAARDGDSAPGKSAGGTGVAKRRASGYERAPAGYGPAPVVRSGRKIGRNEKCPCGSGLKYKRCCGR